MLVRRVGVISFIFSGSVNRQAILLLNQLLGSLFYRTSGYVISRFVLTSFLIFFCVAPVVRGAELFAEPYARFRYGYNDNVRLTLADHEISRIEKTIAGLKLVAREERWDTSILGEFSRINYSPIDDYDSDNTRFDLDSSYKTEKIIWSLTGSFKDESVLINETIDIDTGLTQFQRQRIKKNIAPSVSWILNEKIQATWSIGYTDVSYDDNTDAGILFDYENTTNTFFASYGMTERSQLLVQLSSSGFKSQRTESDDLVVGEWRGTESVTRNYMLGMGYDLDENTNLQLFAGTRKTITDTTIYSCTVIIPPTCFGASNMIFPSELTGSIYTGALERKLESGEVKIDFSRAINPSSGGTEVVSDRMSVRITRLWTRQWRGDLTISYLSNNAIGEDINGNIARLDSEIARLEPKITWHQNRNWAGWSGALSYNYTELRRTFENDPVTRNAVYLTAGYRWSRIDLSL